MTNNKRSFYTIISFSFPRLIKGSYNIIASSHYLGTIFEPYKFTSDMLAKRLETFFDNTLKIVFIANESPKISTIKIGDSIYNDFIIIDIPSESFFSTDIIEKILIKNKKIHQFIFIFKDRDYRDIVSNLALFNIIISGGSNTKKHILSPIQLRLARFLIAFLPMTGSNVVNSFHPDRIGKTSGYDWTTKEAKEVIEQKIEYLLKENEEKEEPQDTSSVISKGDSITLAQRATVQRGNREFHTISCLQNKHVLSDKVSSNLIEIAPVPVKPLANTISGEKGKKGSSSILSYLDSIKSIINNPNNSPEKAQSLIENSWLFILMEQLNDEKKLINKYSHRFSDILLEVNKTLNSLQENNVIKRKFPFLYKDLDSIDFIFILTEQGRHLK